MRRTITLNTFRKVHVAEEAIIRASMPRTSAADIEPLAFYANAGPKARRTFTMKAGWTLREVAHAARQAA